MKRIDLSTKIFICLVLAYALLAGISILLPIESYLPIPQEQELPAPKPILAIANFFMILVFYGGLGFFGLKLGKKIGFTEIWDTNVSNKQRFLIPGLWGLATGVFLIVADKLFSRFHNLGPLPHPPFPFSIIASITAGIGEEIIFRLFFITFWVWLISYVILKKKWQNNIFWIVSIISALAFGLGHLPALMILFEYKSIAEIPLIFLIEIITLNGVVSMIAAYYFRKYGFLAPVGIHFWTDVVFHVIWGLF